MYSTAPATGRGEKLIVRNPLSIYGASKLAGEDAVRAARGAHLIVRTEWVYAATGKNFLRTIARLALERKELRVVDDQYGAPTSAHLIAHVVAGIVCGDSAAVVERFAAAGGLVNVAASGVTTWHGFATAIVEGLKSRGLALAVERVVPIATPGYPTKAKRPANSRFDLTHLKEVFGIETPDWNELLPTELDLVAHEMLDHTRSVGVQATGSASPAFAATAAPNSPHSAP